MSPERFVKGESERTNVSDPDTWVTECTSYIGNTFGPKGFSGGSKTRVSRSKYPRS